MKNRFSKNNSNDNGEKNDGSESSKKMMMNKKKKNIRRMGGGGLSLEAFVNAKTKSKDYNPAIIKKKREFYKNAKCVTKYKKSLKQQNQQDDPSSSTRQEDENVKEEAGRVNPKIEKNKKISSRNLEVLYEKKREEEEKARMEREAIIQAMKEGREKSLSRRKALREKMFKKTRSGQPVMKYRIEHLLETIQGSKT